MSNIYFTSDTHYNHKNICRGTSDWGKETDEVHSGIHSVQRTRDFKTLDEMNLALIERLNSRVKQEDTLYHLGDWSFGGAGSIGEFRNRINCRTIHLIFGNHDQHIEPVASLHRQYFSSCQYYKELKIQGQHIILLHYAMRVWNKSHRKSIHLYAHSHGTLPGFGKSMDVGVDTNNLYPYSLEEIVEKMNKIEVKIVDHHNKNTN